MPLIKDRFISEIFLKGKLNSLMGITGLFLESVNQKQEHVHSNFMGRQLFNKVPKLGDRSREKW